jgi:hypothetical protein
MRTGARLGSPRPACGERVAEGGVRGFNSGHCSGETPAFRAYPRYVLANSIA